MVLDPFCGSGSTGVAAVREGFSFLGMEQDEKYVALAEARLAKASITQLPNEESAEDTEAEVPT
jgi:site-specific DNA-methyltransferase (adenine-specific)